MSVVRNTSSGGHRPSRTHAPIDSPRNRDFGSADFVASSAVGGGSTTPSGELSHRQNSSLYARVVAVASGRGGSGGFVVDASAAAASAEIFSLQFLTYRNPSGTTSVASSTSLNAGTITR